MLSPCGVDCEACKEVEICGGCRKISGKVSWAAYVGETVCPMYRCCVSEKGLSHCGECSSLPCRLYYDTRDPAVSQEEHETGVKARVQALKNQKSL
jgi:hypothetical protein